jgi:hypothetical protein
MQLVFGQYWFKKSELETDESTQSKNKHIMQEEKNKKLFCIYCKNHITYINEAIPIEGAHTHTCSNPAGYVYTISCYRTAPGCLVVGNSTNEFSWFKNYDWQLVTCKACHEHLGWLFSNEQQFYALIADRLTQSASF